MDAISCGLVVLRAGRSGVGGVAGTAVATLGVGSAFDGGTESGEGLGAAAAMVGATAG